MPGWQKAGAPSASRTVPVGVVSAGLRTAVFPAATAGAIFRTAIARPGRRAQREDCDESDERQRLRRENAQLKRDSKELVVEREVLKRCTVLWVRQPWRDPPVVRYAA